MLQTLIRANLEYRSLMACKASPDVLEVRRRLVEAVVDILATLNNNDSWAMVTSSEVHFDSELCRFVEIGTSKVTDNNAIKKNVKKFARLLVIAKEILVNLQQDTTMMKRELYYRHSDMVEGQEEFDIMIQEMSYRLKLPRHSIKFVT